MPDFHVADDEVPTSLSITALPGAQFRSLGYFVPIYRALAALLAVGAIGSLVYAIFAAVTLQDAAERSSAVGLSIVAFVLATLAAGLHLVIAELVRVALAIEERTR
jgi:hypothetical protein